MNRCLVLAAALLGAACSPSAAAPSELSCQAGILVCSNGMSAMCALPGEEPTGDLVGCSRAGAPDGGFVGGCEAPYETRCP